ncbi:hypothetical protein GCM10022392_13180 [Mucilaginibacter panaciglaebae]|uniref:Uncharacterized protein n=1 Tax=Mucilaginibacter panaciglaebae TaxID=502331 RepID=A0ABP7WMS5_9SPHI
MALPANQTEVQKNCAMTMAGSIGFMLEVQGKAILYLMELYFTKTN